MKGITIVLLFFYTFASAQESTDGFEIACEASELNVNTQFLGPDFSKLKAQANSSVIDVTYSGFPSDAKAAFQAAIDVWAKVLISRVPIKITATWTTISTNTLATSGSKKVYKNFSGAPFKDVWFPSALAETLAGQNLNGTDADISINVNKNISWSYKTDGSKEAFKYDLMTVILHEIAHGLGFTTSMKLGDSNTTQAQWGIEGLPLIYDVFSQREDGIVLTNTGKIGNPSTALKEAITSSNVFFKISDGYYSGDLPKLYAPSTYRSGGTMSHLDESKYPKGTENSLMSPQVGAAEINHFPGEVILAILNQIGWAVNFYDGNVVTAIEPQSINQELIIYPNPSSDFLNIYIPEIYHDKNINVRIFDINGSEKNRIESRGESTLKVDISQLSFGRYVLKIAESEAKIFIKN
ncbi:T9SS C-terminal target domain-containing protein [Lacihabitans sp. LS3-19]|uniref:T9SS type A sorting domain-containing protein n=1 Tax=Lacihabitans sp. LS3-19 TaxID=2487335 RepID=UPI0020CD82C2|nr:T9SS type A sorting domain-containing protein [Lacihabitans sp. LS3-19]MCP9770856.1 T9SS C-terminal target domain-containing protein [Lacihabitans sp. LS3-19]